MGTMLFIDKNHYEHAETPLHMMKFVDFDVMHHADHSTREKTNNLFKYIQI